MYAMYAIGNGGAGGMVSSRAVCAFSQKSSLLLTTSRAEYVRYDGFAFCTRHGLRGLRRIRSETLRPPSHTDAGRFLLGESMRDEQRRTGLSMHATK